LMLEGIGDWGLVIGDWVLGPIPNPQSPIPNPQSPIPIDVFKSVLKLLLHLFIKNLIHLFIKVMNIINKSMKFI